MTHREKVEGGDGFPRCGMKNVQTPQLASTLTEARTVEKFERWEEEVLLNVIDGRPGVVSN